MAALSWFLSWLVSQTIHAATVSQDCRHHGMKHDKQAAAPNANFAKIRGQIKVRVQQILRMHKRQRTKTALNDPRLLGLTAKTTVAKKLSTEKNSTPKNPKLLFSTNDILNKR